MAPTRIPGRCAAMLTERIRVGAMVMRKGELTQLVRRELHQRGWLRKGTGSNVTGFREEFHEGGQEEEAALSAVHLSHDGVVAMEAWMEDRSALEIPGELQRLLEDGSLRWVPGVRVFSRACAETPAPQLSLIHI
eukprot:TRINITY_DN51503_c0_g1_i1.p4 TRINITY_DN51503_c0_g1~~TRINITY_DN51503_c0_g1_i1.p4  ORF type:complete len:135 (-),score=30.48 TRINITY_DN51503_c0_g1_i1:42-446(-)